MVTMNPALTKIKKLVERNVEKGMKSTPAVKAALKRTTATEHRTASKGLYEDIGEWEDIKDEWDDTAFYHALLGKFGDYADDYHAFIQRKRVIPW